MKIFIMVLLILLLLFIILIFSSVKLSLLFTHKGDNDYLRLKVSVWKVISYTFEVPEIKLNVAEKKIELKEETKGAGNVKKKRSKITVSSIKQGYRSFHRLVLHVKDFYQTIKRFLKKVNVSEVSWHTQIGLGDAASTAMASGLLWAVKGNGLGVLSHFVNLKGVPKIQVIPVYQGTLTQTRLACMISFKIGHAIVVMFQMLKHWRRINSSRMKKSKKYTAGGTTHV